MKKEKKILKLNYDNVGLDTNKVGHSSYKQGTYLTLLLIFMFISKFLNSLA